MADDKTQRIVEAAKNRTRAEREVAERNGPVTEENRFDEAEQAQMQESAQKMADLKPQAAAGTIDGEIDLEARGDVKGDGGDAKNYDDGDPDKYVSPTTAEYGLSEDTVRGPYFAGTSALGDRNISEQTRAEMERGRKVVDGRGGSRSRPTTRTVITDDSDDADAINAKARADAKAKAEREAKENAKK